MGSPLPHCGILVCNNRPLVTPTWQGLSPAFQMNERLAPSFKRHLARQAQLIILEIITYNIVKHLV